MLVGVLHATGNTGRQADQLNTVECCSWQADTCVQGLKAHDLHLQGWTALHVAADHGCVKAVEALLRCRAEVSPVNSEVGALLLVSMRCCMQLACE